MEKCDSCESKVAWYNEYCGRDLVYTCQTMACSTDHYCPATKRVSHIMDIRMLRWSMGVTLEDRVPNQMVRSSFGVAPITDKMKEAWLRWCGHVQRRGDGSVTKTALNLDFKGTRPRGRAKLAG
ncbi:hypothetical protein ANCDUO_10615 [Ancylostoma duodenale]|uniref:Uncharacterized protein n=1 Tax=Ancylostoma duodenale TaxID=51022 RepID=A0A0C2GDD5_9BILA|nr:hypothetical protein ANCDUO_10615 [Ancylostoma duodenale]